MLDAVFVRMAACIGLLVAGGCGHGGTTAKNGVISCRAPDADRPLCVESEPYNDDMRLVAISQCRESGGRVGTECPTEDLVGSCERVNQASVEKRQPWEFSKRSRMYYYSVPGALAGPPDVAMLKAQCEQQQGRGSTGQWTGKDGGS